MLELSKLGLLMKFILYLCDSWLPRLHKEPLLLVKCLRNGASLLVNAPSFSFICCYFSPAGYPTIDLLFAATSS